MTDIEYAHTKLKSGESERYLFISTWDSKRSFATVLEVELKKNNLINSKKVSDDLVECKDFICEN